MNNISFQISNELCIVVIEGKITTVKQGEPNFKALCSALQEKRWADVHKHLSATKTVEDWVNAIGGGFSARQGALYYGVDALPVAFAGKIRDMVTAGENPTLLFKFWERLQKNPSSRSVAQLWDFIGHCGIPLTDDGYFLAYKSVRDDYLDHHTGTIANTIGSTHEMQRNKISDDPAQTCHFGFHVGALPYAQNTMPTGRIIICKVDPENVVCVPNDYSAQKMRVCKYEVIGHYTAPLNNLKHEEDVTEDNELDEDLCEVCGQPNCDECDADAYLAVEPDERKSTPKGRWAKLNAMGSSELLEQSLATLRNYACKGLKMIGASKVPGGKVALIKRILKCRG